MFATNKRRRDITNHQENKPKKLFPFFPYAGTFFDFLYYFFICLFLVLFLVHFPPPASSTPTAITTSNHLSPT
jgi:quinol-cytochrome oxidoreductase complex cytochrome b subunit